MEFGYKEPAYVEKYTMDKVITHYYMNDIGEIIIRKTNRAKKLLVAADGSKFTYLRTNKNHRCIRFECTSIFNNRVRQP